MEKEPMRLIFRAIPLICLLSLLLLYSDYYGSSFLHFDQWKENYPSSRIGITSKQIDKTADEHETQLTSKGSEKRVDKEQSQLASREESKIVNEHEPELSSRVVDKAEEEPEAHLISRRDGKEIDGHESQVSNRGVVETEEEQESQLSNNGVDERGDEQESQHSIREVEETDKEHEYEVSSREVNTTVDEKGSQLLIREVNETVDEQEHGKSLLARLVRGEDRRKLESTGFACDRARFSIVCVANKPVTIDTNTMTVYVPTDQAAEHNKTEVRPYARQDDIDLLQRITPVDILQGNATPPACENTHNVPAVIFCSSGFTGNLFHEFNEVIIPLYLTTLHLHSRVLFIATDYKPAFINKYNKVFSRLSSYEVMNPGANRSKHCFSGAVVGLKYHDNLALNSSDIPGGYSMPDFRQFIRNTYNLKIMNVSEITTPVLMLMSRTGTRRFLNEGEMVNMMKELGFKVIVVRRPDKMSNLNKFAKVVNKCSVLVGTHGAGLANELFLPTGGVMVQVEPLGLEWGSAFFLRYKIEPVESSLFGKYGPNHPLGLEWGSAFFYGNPAAAMGVHYLRYKIEPEESSLLGKYGRNHPVISDPDSIYAQGYQAGRAVYLDQQNVKVNVSKFRETLTEALKLIGQSAPLR